MELFDFILHFDEHLKNIIQAFGPLTYVILFLIVFAETGLVVAPFLPGDSLLFVAGTLAGSGLLNLGITYITLLFAALLGDTINYWIGNIVGPRVFAKENSRIFKKTYLERTREFYEKHGGKTIILARFMPIIRTFAPFVAGVGKMHYKTFVFYNIIGAFIWVTSLTFAGYFFGGLPIIKNNFEYAVIVIIVVSLLPMVIEYIRHRKGPKMTRQQLEKATYQDIQKTLKKEHLND
ncbi:MAG: DedA family protein [Candidatus Levybacteria bacterium]|nr:DedA family protein [Candidatus Levybacteria bacterium]